MKWEKVTTMEHLWSDGCSTQGAVLKYGEKVLVTGLTYRGFEAAIYVQTVDASSVQRSGIPLQNTAVLSGSATTNSKDSSFAPHRIYMKMKSNSVLSMPFLYSFREKI